MSGFFSNLLSAFRRRPEPAPPARVDPPRLVGPVTLALMHAAAPTTPSAKLLPFVDPLNVACSEFGITTAARVAAFLAQCAHESDGFATTTEYASGDAYEGRRDLGNIENGDGRRYKGHGLIQVTGRTNHKRMADYFGVPFVRIVDWLQSPEGACRSAGLYWADHHCNALADLGKFDEITRAINGGYNGKADRDSRYASLLAEFNATETARA